MADPVKLSTADQARLRAHLGYSSLVKSGVLAFGGIVPTQYHFLLDYNQTNLRQADLPRLIRLLDNLDEIECLLMDATRDLKVKRTGGGLELRDDATHRLEVEYCRWALRVADMLSVPVNPLARRFVEGYGGVSIPVV